MFSAINEILLLILINIYPKPHASNYECEVDNDCNPFYYCTDEGYAIKSIRQRKKHKVCAPRTLPLIQNNVPDMIDHIVEKQCGGTKRLSKLLKGVAKRESNYKFWTSHWMPSDVSAGKIALKRNRERYADNEYVDDTHRWQTVGLFGLTSANFLYRYNPNADPLDIANPVVSVHVWLQAARDAHKKLRTGLQCENIGLYKPDIITYADIHRAVNGGSLCPRTGAKHNWMKRNAAWAFKTKYSKQDLNAKCI